MSLFLFAVLFQQYGRAKQYSDSYPGSERD